MSGKSVTDELARLRLTNCPGIGPAAIEAIESASGVALADYSRTFLARVGECHAAIRVASGPAAGNGVVLLGEKQVMAYVRDDLAGGGLIPFATSLFGDLFCLRDRDGAQDVVLLNLSRETATPVARNLQEFLSQLAPYTGDARP